MENIVSSVGPSNAMAAANLLSMDASQFGNDPSYEFMWATKTFKYAEVHFQLISSFDPSKLRLTKYDDQIYRMFKRFFKYFKVDIIEEEALKSEEAKAKWRPFCELFKGKIEDYNFGTLLRIDSSKAYSDDNTILVTRVQFFAIEVARNRRGLNNSHYQNKLETESTEVIKTAANKDNNAEHKDNNELFKDNLIEDDEKHDEN